MVSAAGNVLLSKNRGFRVSNHSNLHPSLTEVCKILLLLPLSLKAQAVH